MPKLFQNGSSWWTSSKTISDGSLVSQTSKEIAVVGIQERFLNDRSELAALVDLSFSLVSQPLRFRLSVPFPLPLVPGRPLLLPSAPPRPLSLPLSLLHIGSTSQLLLSTYSSSKGQEPANKLACLPLLNLYVRKLCCSSTSLMPCQKTRKLVREECANRLLSSLVLTT